MSLLRKTLLAVVPVAALCVPFMAAAPVQAHEEHHEHWEHHEHHSYHWFPEYHSPHVVLSVPPVVYATPPVVYSPPVTLYYRSVPAGPWVAYNTFPGYSAANNVALSLRLRGFEIFIR